MGEVLALCYHAISETWPAETSVKPGDFERQLSTFVRRGYRGATLSEALTAPTPGRTLVVTFDDAHRSVRELAAPAMACLGIPGTVFVPTDCVGSGGLMAWGGYDVWLGTEHEHELRCMTWQELRDLAASGWEVGSHTCSHPRLPQLGEVEIAAELTDSRGECEECMGVPCRSIAYPYSDYDDRVVGAARESGYQFGATVPRSPCAPLPLAWPRVGVYHGEGPRRVRLRAQARRLGPSVPARTALALRGLRR